MRRVPRAELVLPLAIVLGAVVLGASEFMVTFEFTPPGGEALRDQLASDRHSYSLLILALFSVASMLAAIATGLRAAAFATAAFGVAALLLFLLLDLPDAGNTGPLDDDSGTLFFANATAEPQIGFWLEAIGSLALGLAAGAFATLHSDQLRAPARLLVRRREKRGAKAAEDRTPRETPAKSAATTQPALEPAAAKAGRTTLRPASARRPRGRKGNDAVVPFDLEVSDDETKAQPSSNGRLGFLARLKSSGR